MWQSCFSDYTTKDYMIKADRMTLHRAGVVSDNQFFYLHRFTYEQLFKNLVRIAVFPFSYDEILPVVGKQECMQLFIKIKKLNIF